MKQSEIQSILIVRLSAIGDIVMASPLISAIRTCYPQAHIAWLVQSGMEDLLDKHPDLDEVIVWRRGEWRRLWRQRRGWRLLTEFVSFVRRLRSEHFDLAIDAQGLLKSGVWVGLSGAKQRVGLGCREGSHLFMTRLIDKPQGDPMIGSEYRHLIRTMGWDGGSFRMMIGLNDDDRRRARDLVGQYHLQRGYAVFCPFTTRPQKHWVNDYWRELAARIHDESSLPVVMLGGPDDVAAAEELAADGNIINCVGATGLRQAAALIETASLLIGVDTGLMHMGSAFAVPTIALFGSTCPYRDAGVKTTVIMYKNLECSPCRRKPSCEGEFTCMKMITVDDVMAETNRLLGRG